MKFNLKTKLFGVLVFCCISLRIQAQTAVSMNGKLKLVGNQLSSECGNPVQLRGMSTHGLNYYPSCVNSAVFASLNTDWKCDIVRLAMYVNESNGYLTDPATWKLKIDRWVDQIGALGMYCIIDWHILNPGDPNISIENAKEFWGYISKTHKGKKHVIYEICNEPNGVDWNTVKTYANTIIPIIRANDPETIIVVGTPLWSGKPGDVINNKISGTNIMYTFHFYAASHSSYRSEIQSAAASIPIFATEWGLSESSGGGAISISEGQLWMDIFAGNNNGKQKISWCNWSFSDKAESSAALKANSCGTSSWTNVTESGAQVKTWISSPAKSFTSCGPSCKAPNLGSDISLCGLSGGVTLNTGLSTLNKTFVWKRGTITLAETTPSITTSIAGTYTVTVDSMGCVNTDEIILASTLPTVNLGATSNLCNPSTKVLDAGVSGSAMSYKWKKANVVVGNTKTYTVSEAGTYSVTISAANCTDQTGSVVITSSLPVVTSDTICKNESAILVASGTGPFDWYATTTSTAKLFTGATYSVTPTVNTTYYVQATPGQDYKMGPTDKGTGAWDIGGSTDFGTADKQITISALGNVTLKSLEVDPQSGAQNVTINVTDMSTNTIVKTVSQAIPASQTAITIGASLVSGKKYKIDAIGTVGRLYFRNQGATLWPQTTANIATIESNASGYGTNWSSFYNIVLSTGTACNRVPVSVIMGSCTGIEEETEALNSVRVFPNPFENGFNLSLGASNGLVQKIELSDMEGRILETKSKAQMEEQMLLGENLPNGQYFLRIITNNKVMVKPIVKLK